MQSTDFPPIRSLGLFSSDIAEAGEERQQDDQRTGKFSSESAFVLPFRLNHFREPSEKDEIQSTGDMCGEQIWRNSPNWEGFWFFLICCGGV